jgi:phospholipase C
MAPLMGLPGQKTPHGKTLHYEIIHSKITARADRWGVGVRVPGIIISPFARNSFVDHTEYETISILKLI